jgi:hypothetical protein
MYPLGTVHNRPLRRSPLEVDVLRLEPEELGIRFRQGAPPPLVEVDGVFRRCGRNVEPTCPEPVRCPRGFREETSPQALAPVVPPYMQECQLDQVPRGADALAIDHRYPGQGRLVERAGETPAPSACLELRRLRFWSPGAQPGTSK